MMDYILKKGMIGRRLDNVASKILPQFILILCCILVAVSHLHAQEDPYELKTGHPRIIMTKYDELALRFVLMEDDLAIKLQGELKKDADKLLNSKEIKYALDRRNTMLSISREYLKRIITLSLAYRVFEENKYSDKAIDHMMHVCEFPDWNPQHFLDVAEMTAALAIGYDWNFYHLDSRQKETIRNKIVEFGLNPGLEVYQKPTGKPHVWYKMNNNWNQVCAGGLILGALAVGEDFPDLKNKIIYQALKNLIPTLNLYQPDGVWYEGPAYWGYANSFLAMSVSALSSSLEHDFGVSERPGLSLTAKFYVNSISPTGKVFNFADAGSSNQSLNPALFWFGKTYDLPEVSSYYKTLLERNVTNGSAEYGQGRGRIFYMALPWYVEGVSEGLTRQKAQKFEGLVDLLFLQGQENNANSIYLAAKGGKGTLNHQQLDAGTFVIDANGERWGKDLGAENYFLPNFFQREVGGERWKYYRNTNKSHSTLVIGDEIQYADGECKIIEFEEQGDQPFGVFDLSPAYTEAKRVQRGFKLLSDNQILVRDEVEFDANANTVKWGFMTDAKVEVQGDQATLTKNGKKFVLKAFSGIPVNFEVEAAKANHPEAKDNTGNNLVYLVLNQEKAQKIVEVSVVMGENVDGVNPGAIQTKLATW